MTVEHKGKKDEKAPERPETELTDEDLGHVSGGTRPQEISARKVKTADKAADAIDHYIRG